MAVGINPESDLPALLEACYRQDATAQRELYVKWYAFARGRAAPYGQHDEEVEEIVQDAFLKIFQALGREVSVGQFAGYFHRIIVNAGIDYYRRHRKHHHHTAALPLTLPQKGAPNKALTTLEREDCIRLLQQLPPTHRMVFNLYVFEGYRHSEIAKQLRIGESTSRAYLFKARQSLRPLVGPYLQTNTVSHDE